MPRFNFAGRPQFGRQAPADAPGDKRLTHTARDMVRRQAQLAEAAAVLAVLPAAGEALHAVITGRYDMMELVTVLIGRVGKIEHLRIATLSFNERNHRAMKALLDDGKTAKLTLLCSTFFRNYNKDFWEDVKSDFAERKQRCSAARSHCKVICLDGTGGKYVIEGSANLRHNNQLEQFALIRDDALHDFHAAWIDETVDKHEPGE